MKKQLITLFAVVIFIMMGIESYLKTVDTIKIKGTISGNAQYRIHASYEATSDLWVCTSWSMFGGRQTSIKTFWYTPTITNGHHQITIPTKEISMSFICGYELSHINIQINSNEKPTKRNYYNSVGGTLFAKRFKSDTRPDFFYQSIDDTLNIECVNDLSSSYTCRQAPYVQQIMLTQSFTKQRDYTVNIKFLSREDVLTQKAALEATAIKEMEIKKRVYSVKKQIYLLEKLLISPYIKTYKKLPDDAMVQKLLYQKNTMPYFSEKQRTKNSQELQEHITYQNGYPVDSWGNRFQYKIKNNKYATLFSFGPDGLESEDDIASGYLQGIPDPLYNEDHTLKQKLCVLERV